jgi:hypothetical protein
MSLELATPEAIFTLLMDAHRAYFSCGVFREELYGASVFIEGNNSCLILCLTVLLSEETKQEALELARRIGDVVYAYEGNGYTAHRIFLHPGT